MRLGVRIERAAKPSSSFAELRAALSPERRLSEASWLLQLPDRGQRPFWILFVRDRRRPEGPQEVPRQARAIAKQITNTYGGYEI